MRLGSATEHFNAIARLIQEPPIAAYGPASLARTALENSARSWRAFDPSLDVKMRIARARTDIIANLIELQRARGAIERLEADDPNATDEEQAENQAMRDKVSGTLSEIVADCEG